MNSAIKALTGTQQCNVDDIVRHAFSVVRDPRSTEYQAGARAALAFHIEGAHIAQPFEAGSAACDAFNAGITEGHAIWRRVNRDWPTSAVSETGVPHQSIEDLCKTALWLRAWWRQYSGIVRVASPVAAAEINDRALDCAMLANTVAGIMGLDLDEQRIESFAWGGRLQDRHDGPLHLLNHNLGIEDPVFVSARSHVGGVGMDLEEALRRIDQFDAKGQQQLLAGVVAHFGGAA